jgi:hypothetical protein
MIFGALVVLLSTGVSTHSQLERPAPVSISVDFDWEMEKRFNRDDNNNGMVDLPNSFEYVHNLQPCSCNPCSPPTPKFKVVFKAPQSIVLRGAGQPERLPITNYKWTLSRSGIQPQSNDVTVASWESSLEEGIYTVTLTVQANSLGSNVRLEPKTKQVPIKDYLIVSIGDSVSSGEGNPEKTGRLVTPYSGGTGAKCQVNSAEQVYWADDDGAGSGNHNTFEIGSCPTEDGTGSFLDQIRPNAVTQIGKDHIRSHRSSVSWPAQLALAIEETDPHTSVTFISFAASGARIWAGLIGPYAGVDNEPLTRELRDSPMRPQIEQVASVVGNRQIDTLLISVGANDISFSTIAQALALHRPGRGEITNSRIKQAIKDGQWGRFDGWLPTVASWKALSSNGLAWPNLVNGGLDHLPGQFDRLNAAILEKLKANNPFGTYIIEYPDFSYRLNSSGRPTRCDEILSQVTWPYNIDNNELAWAEQNALLPLNDTIQTAATRHGWIYVGGIKSQFSQGHGACALDPYDPDHYTGFPHPQQVAPVPATPGIRWIRQAEESADIQGFGKKGTKGVLHPNEFGHRVIRDRVLASLHLPVEIPLIGIQDTDDQIIEATVFRNRRLGPGLRKAETISPATDVDMFSLYISRHERINIDIKVPTDSLLQPRVRLFDQNGSEIPITGPRLPSQPSQPREGDSPRGDQPFQPSLSGVPTSLLGRPAAYEIEEPGHYYVGISSDTNKNYNPITGFGRIAGGTTGSYSLAGVQTAYDPDNTLSTANTIILPSHVDGYGIEIETDVDMFAFEHQPGPLKIDVTVWTDPKGNGTFAASLEGERFQSELRPSLRLFDATGRELTHAEGQMTYTITTNGKYYLGVSSVGNNSYDPTQRLASFPDRASDRRPRLTSSPDRPRSRGLYALQIS